MLKKRLIPKLQMKFSQATNQTVLVSTVGFSNTIEIGDPVSQAKIYQAQAADELIFLDLDAAVQNRQPLVDIIHRAAEEIFMPFTVGGGVKTVADFRNLLSNGADKVSINTSAVETPDFINQAAGVFGAQCVVVSIDYKWNMEGNCTVWTLGGTHQTSLHPVAWAIEAARRGAGEILLTSIDRDGSRSGLDLKMTREVAESVDVPVITSGGCGLTSHFIEGFQEGQADAVAAGTYFCFKDENPMQTRSHIKNAGIAIRLHT